MVQALPTDVLAVFEHMRTCEFTTIGKDGTPLTWPLVFMYTPENGQFILSTSIGFMGKIYNIRRNPHVTMLFSDPTGSGLDKPPIVQVQGEATTSKGVTVLDEGLLAYYRKIARYQPQKPLNRFQRWFMDFYYMRVRIDIVPHTIRWWPNRDLNAAPQMLELAQPAPVQA